MLKISWDASFAAREIGTPVRERGQDVEVDSPRAGGQVAYEVGEQLSAWLDSSASHLSPHS